MKQLSISYFNYIIHFHPAAEMGCVPAPKGYRNMTDANLDDCFSTLVNGRNVWVWYFQDFRRIVVYLLSHYKYVKAAGGLVQSSDQKRLIIKREGEWDVPKGMVEAGESIAQAAVREVAEETGVEQVSILNMMLKTYHLYDKYGGWHLKQTTWYAMSAPTSADTTPQTEEGIEKAVWVGIDECREKLSNSFASLRLLSSKIM